MKIEDGAAAGGAADRVEVRLDEFGDLAEQEREAQNQLTESLTVEQRAAMKPVELTHDRFRGVDQFVGFCVGPRKQGKPCRLAKTRVAAAGPNRKCMAKVGIDHGPDEHVGATW